MQRRRGGSQGERGRAEGHEGKKKEERVVKWYNEQKGTRRKKTKGRMKGGREGDTSLLEG